jgi:hypothetical protein
MLKINTFSDFSKTKTVGRGKLFFANIYPYRFRSFLINIKKKRIKNKKKSRLNTHFETIYFVFWRLNCSHKEFK